MVTDSLSDMLTRIRNAQRVGHKVVRVPSINLCRSVLEVLKREGFIDAFVVRKEEGKFDECEVHLKYYSDGEPVMRRMTRVSKPGRRVYAGTDELPKVLGGLGMAVISTPQGVVSDREARKRGVGGEVLAVIG